MIQKKSETVNPNQEYSYGQLIELKF